MIADANNLIMKTVDMEHWPLLLRHVVRNWLPSVIAMILILLIAYKLAAITWSLMGVGIQDANIARSDISRNVPDKAMPVRNYQNISMLHMFGEQNQEKIERPIAAIARETTLSLTLFGVFVDSVKENASAIISDAGNEQKYFRVGDTISGTAVLKEVHADRVIILHNGNYETLKFPNDDRQGLSIDRSPDTGVSNRDSGQDNSPVDPITAMTDKLQVVPVIAGGVIQGYKLLPKKDRDFYARLGIRPSDIITSVNGIKLDNSADAIKVFQELSNPAGVILGMTRYGKAHTVNINLTNSANSSPDQSAETSAMQDMHGEH